MITTVLFCTSMTLIKIALDHSFLHAPYNVDAILFAKISIICFINAVLVEERFAT